MEVAEWPDCGRCSEPEETAENGFYRCPQVYQLWEYAAVLVARMDLENVLHLDVSYICHNVTPSWYGLKRVTFLALLAVRDGRARLLSVPTSLPTLVAHMELENVLHLDVFYIFDNVASSWQGLKRIRFSHSQL